MPFKVQLNKILYRLTKRFDLMRIVPVPEIMELDPRIQLVSQADPLVRDIKIKKVGSFTRLAAGGAGVETGFTIPAGYKYYIYAVSLQRSGGDGTITTMYFRGEVGDPDSDDVTIDAVTATAHPAFKAQIYPKPLEEGDIIKFYINALTSDSTWDVRIYYEEERMGAG